MSATKTGTAPRTVTSGAVNGSSTFRRSSPWDSPLPADPGSVASGAGAVPHVDITDSGPYLIEAYLYRPEHAGVRVAYAVRDAFGWAVHARTGKHIETIARVDHLSEVEARAFVCSELTRRIGWWRQS